MFKIKFMWILLIGGLKFRFFDFNFLNLKKLLYYKSEEFAIL